MKKNAQMIIAFVVYVSILFSSAAASNNEPLGILVYPSSGYSSLASQPDHKDVVKTFDKESTSGQNGTKDLKSIIWYLITSDIFIPGYSPGSLKSTLTADSIRDFKMDFEHEQNKQIMTSYDWIDSSWVLLLKEEKYFSGFSPPDSIITYRQDSLSSSWLYAFRDINYFDTQGNDTCSINYLFDTNISAWKNSSKNVYHFDENGNRVQSDFFTWDEQQSKWLTQSRIVNYYTGDYNDSTYIFLWNYGTSGWDTISKSVNQYHEDKLKDVTTNYGRNQTEHTWFLSQMSFRSYNGEGLIDTSGRYSWNPQTTEWDPLELNTYSYFNGKVRLDSKYNWDSQSGQLKLDTKAYYYYLGESTGIEKFELANLTIFPNPAHKQVTINVENPENCYLQVYDLKGRLILNRRIVNQITNLPLTNFKAGTYLFKIENKRRVATRKILIQ